MHLQPQTLSAAGDSPWIIPHPLPIATNIGLALTFSSNANLTANVQYTYDDPLQNYRLVTLARAATVLTITDNNHGLNVGDAISLSNPNADPNNSWDGGSGGQGTNYDVASIVDQNNYTVTVANSGAASAGGAVRSFRLFLHPTLKAITGTPPVRTDGSLGWPVGAIRLNVTGYVAGSVTLTAQEAKGY
jgi:hypothetical protein